MAAVTAAGMPDIRSPRQQPVKKMEHDEQQLV